MSKVKVWNKNKHRVGARYMNGMEVVFEPGSCREVPEEEVLYWSTSTGLFKKKHLYFDEKVQPEVVENLHMDGEIEPFKSDDEVKELLKGNFKKLESYLDNITEAHEKARFVEVAKSMDLTASKIRLIEEKTGMQVMGDDLS